MVKVNIHNEISWFHFKQLNEIKNLPIVEQTRQYNLYINELTYQRNVYLHWLEGHKKGPLLKIRNIGFLLQENLFDLEQEDGSKIFITALTK